MWTGRIWSRSTSRVWKPLSPTPLLLVFCPRCQRRSRRYAVLARSCSTSCFSSSISFSSAGPLPEGRGGIYCNLILSLICWSERRYPASRSQVSPPGWLRNTVFADAPQDDAHSRLKVNLVSYGYEYGLGPVPRPQRRAYDLLSILELSVGALGPARLLELTGQPGLRASYGGYVEEEA